MRAARRNSWEQGIRINYVAPCWIKSAIRTAAYEKWLVDRGIKFGETVDCGGCMMRISCDKSINGRPPQFVKPQGKTATDHANRTLPDDRSPVDGQGGLYGCGQG